MIKHKKYLLYFFIFESLRGFIVISYLSNVINKTDNIPDINENVIKHPRNVQKMLVFHICLISKNL